MSQVGNDVRDDGFDDGSILGAENSVAWQDVSRHVPNAVLTINAALWPRTSALFKHPGTTLSAEETRWVEQAAATVSKLTSDVAAFDARSVTMACAKGDRFATASSGQLAAVEVAIAPVIADLERDAATKAVMDQIRALKPTSLPQEYSVAENCIAP